MRKLDFKLVVDGIVFQDFEIPSQLDFGTTRARKFTSSSAAVALSTGWSLLSGPSRGRVASWDAPAVGSIAFRQTNVPLFPRLHSIAVLVASILFANLLHAKRG